MTGPKVVHSTCSSLRGITSPATVRQAARHPGRAPILCHQEEALRSPTKDPVEALNTWYSYMVEPLVEPEYYG